MSKPDSRKERLDALTAALRNMITYAEAGAILPEQTAAYWALREERIEEAYKTLTDAKNYVET